MAEPRNEGSRPVTHAELRNILLIMGVDITNEESINRASGRRQFTDDEITRRRAAKERTLAYGAGFVRWLAAGAGTALVGWLTGALPWLKLYLTGKG